MKKLLVIALLSIIALQTSPAQARHWGWGPGIGFGIGFGFGGPYWGGYPYGYGYAPYGYAPYPYGYPVYPAAYPAYPAGYRGPVTLPEKQQDAPQERAYRQDVRDEDKAPAQPMKIREK